ncbi:MAG: LamG domain-containing protein, partial [Opitutales bacterium]
RLTAPLPHGEPGPPRAGANLPPFIQGLQLPGHDYWTGVHWEGVRPELGSPGVRVIESGRFWLAQNTGTLAFPSFGGFGDRHPGAYATGAYPTYDLAFGRPADEEAPGQPLARPGPERTGMTMPTGLKSLSLTVDGVEYDIIRGKPWDGKSGPRVMESGRFLQRMDILGLDVSNAQGQRLQGDFRFETVAWPDRLSFLLHARPPLEPILEGEASFGVRGGGFGLTGSNHLEIPSHPSLAARSFTLELWVYVPEDTGEATKQTPWIFCRGANEESAGGLGITLAGTRLAARFNGPGGRKSARMLVSPSEVRTEAWNHVALTYDGGRYVFFVNGAPAGHFQEEGARVSGDVPITIGRRGDGHGDGYHFKGVVDELRSHPRALTASEIGARAARRPAATIDGGLALSFNDQVAARERRGRREWKDVRMGMAFGKPGNDTRSIFATAPFTINWNGPTPADVSGWHRGLLVVRRDSAYRVGAEPAASGERLTLTAQDKDTGAALPVTWDEALGCFKVDLDSVRGAGQGNDLLERVRLRLGRTGDRRFDDVARVMFIKTAAGLRHALGAPVTGITAVLRGPDGTPTGIPVQLSKNWHTQPGDDENAGVWFHGVTMLQLDIASREVELELALAYGHWGRLPAVSHSQLSLIGWGVNRVWEEAAIGAWGETFCFEPERVQRGNIVLDVRPLMVTPTRGERWQWTNNVGGADWFILETAQSPSARLLPTDVRTAYLSQGPCLSRTVYTGGLGRNTSRFGGPIATRAEVEIGRTTDIARASYRLRLDVKEQVDFQRFTVFQMGSEQYNYPREEAFALGDAGGVLRAWKPEPHGKEDGRTVLGAPQEMAGRTPWVSLHGGKDPLFARTGAFADRGFIIRSWKAVLGGQPANPWIVERNSIPPRRMRTVTLDITAPPGVKSLLPGDYVEALIEHVVIPRSADDYYGPDEKLREALRTRSAPEMVLREAKQGARDVTVSVGRLRSLHPAVSVECQDNRAEITLAGGVGHVPLRFSGLTLPPRRIQVLLDGKPAVPATGDKPAAPAIPGTPPDPASHGTEFWQIEPAPDRRSYAFVINLPAGENPRRITVGEPPPPPAGLPAKEADPR